MNEELVTTLQNLLVAAEQGRIDNLLYFAEVGDNLLVGQEGNFTQDRYEEIIIVTEDIMERMSQLDDSDKAKRLVRV